MHEIKSFYTEKEDGKEILGVISNTYPKDENFYYKHGKHYPASTGCGITSAEKDQRYINWMNKTGLIKSNNNYGLGALNHKRGGFPNPAYPPGFDHTSEWRLPRQQFPLFILTEPYHLPDDEDMIKWEKWKHYFNLDWKIFEPSEKSLHLDNATYMIFIWSPAYVNWDDWKNKLMSHEPFNEFKEKLTYKTVNSKLSFR